MNRETIIQVIHRVLMSIAYKDQTLKNIDIEGESSLTDLEQAIYESIDSDDGSSDVEHHSLYQLKLSPDLDERLLRLLMLMSLGVESAISQLVREILDKKSPSLIKSVANALKRGNDGAKRVLQSVLSESKDHDLQLIKQHAEQAYPSFEQVLTDEPKNRFHPVPKPFDTGY